MFNKVGGRKFALTVLYIVLLGLNDRFGWGVSAAALDQMFYAVGAYVGAEGIKDVVEALKKK